MKKFVTAAALAAQLLAAPSNVASLTDVKEALAALIKKYDETQTFSKETRSESALRASEFEKDINDALARIKALEAGQENLATIEAKATALRSSVDRMQEQIDELAAKQVVASRMSDCGAVPCNSTPQLDEKIRAFIAGENKKD